jgi:transcription antitermination factor NusG
MEMSINEAQDCDAKQWFAVGVKARRESFVSEVVREKGFEGFAPCYVSRRRWSDRFKSVELPLFPGYVFCRLDPRNRLPILTIPGVFQFAGIGKVPVPIDDNEIEAIRIAVESGLSAEPWPFLKFGQRVRLEEGPLAGLEGIYVASGRQRRIVVSVDLLMRSVAITIDREWVRPLDRPCGAIETSSFGSAIRANRVQLANQLIGRGH